MTGKDAQFENYVTNYFAKLRSPDQHRDRVKDRFRYKYARFLPRDPAASLLDIGPGFGEFIELLSLDLGYQQVRAVDISPEVVAYCNQLLPGSTTLARDTVTFLETHRGAFACISMFHVLEHVPKAEAIPLMKAVRGALAPGGVLLLEVPNMANPLTGLSIRYGDFTHEIGYTETSMGFVLQSAGFTRVEAFEGGLPGNHWARVIQRAGQLVFKALIRLSYAVYGLRTPYLYRILSPELCVVASS